MSAIKALRDAGCSLRTISTVQRTLETHWDVGLNEGVLFYNGHEVIVYSHARDAAIAIGQRMAGQAVFTETLTNMTFPLGAWIKQGEQLAQPIDIAAIRARRRASRARRAS